ncbi:MAG: isoprenyl transferase [Fimbriimonadaceae bacterium]|nr:isoprenyl transferase [Alphaproteobacteria bacterium]
MTLSAKKPNQKQDAALTVADDNPGKTTDALIPRHIAIIMDGNGRWAKERGLPRTQGHRHGVEAMRQCIRRASELGVEYLTLFAFSSENWSRPEAEVSVLMGLLKRFVRQDLAKLHENGVRVRIIGAREGLKNDIRQLLEEAESLTRNNTRMTVIVAFNYGARDEIRRAMKNAVAAAAAGHLDPAEITDSWISGHLDTADFPDPDLLIRTSGEQRLSNFLLWQCAYTEFVFPDLYWPDFTGDTLDKAIEDFNARERRYGGLVAKTAS